MFRRPLAFGRPLVGHDRRWPSRWTSPSWSHVGSATSASSRRPAAPSRDSRLSVEIKLARASHRATSARALGERTRQRERERERWEFHLYSVDRRDKERERESDEVSSPSYSRFPCALNVYRRVIAVKRNEKRNSRIRRRCSFKRATLSLPFFFSSPMDESPRSFRACIQHPSASAVLYDSASRSRTRHSRRVLQTVNAAIE